MAALASNETVAVVGAGSMGAGIAQIAAAAGHPTLLFDTNPDAISRAIQNIGKGLSKLVERGRMNARTRAALLSRIHPVTSLEDLGSAKLVIEAIIEDLGSRLMVSTVIDPHSCYAGARRRARDSINLIDE